MMQNFEVWFWVNPKTQEAVNNRLNEVEAIVSLDYSPAPEAGDWRVATVCAVNQDSAEQQLLCALRADSWGRLPKTLRPIWRELEGVRVNFTAPQPTSAPAPAREFNSLSKGESERDRAARRGKDYW